MFGNVYGLDLGTYEIKVYDKKQDLIEKSVQREIDRAFKQKR